MQATGKLPQEYERSEYYGSTIVERIQTIKGSSPQRDWLLFDTVEEAANFFYENQAAG